MIGVPVVSVTVGGDPAPEAAATSVRVRREVSAPAACALTFVTAAGVVDELIRAFHLGAEVAVEVDLGEGARTLFQGDVVTLAVTVGPDASLRLAVNAQDRTQRLRQDSRVRVFVDVSTADLVREIVADLDLDVDSRVDGPRWPRIVQDGRSALDLLTVTTRRAGAWWQVEPDAAGLTLFGAAGSGATAKAHYGRNLLEAVIESTAVGVHDEWRVFGWDPVSGLVADATETSAATTAPTSPTSAARGGLLVAGQDHAAALARALRDDDGARSRTVRAVVSGDPDLVPGVVLAVSGIGDAVDGEFVLLVVDHVIDTVVGYTTTVSSAPPQSLALRGGPHSQDMGDWRSATTPATVLRVDDPSERGRIIVELPAYDGMESEWLPVVALGAGADKGLTCQPDVGDLVVVLHDALDPGRGLVLGGMRTEAGSEPASGITEGSVGSYAMRLPGGQSLRLDRARDLVVAANAAGSTIELSETGVLVHAAGDMVIEAPGKTLTLRANRIDLVQG